jgi:hypothetical protein
VEPTRLWEERKPKEHLVEKHINKSWEKELEGVETYYHTQEKMEGSCRQPVFLMEQQTLLSSSSSLVRFSFFPGTSPLEPVVNPTTQASSLSL